MDSLKADLPIEVYHDTLERLALLHKRRGDYTAAIPLWEIAAKDHQIYAFIELAKYYEHHGQDIDQAAHWTQEALTLLNGLNFPRLERLQWQAELQHRLQRLKRKSAENKV
jgi:hypothetical protein